jgi:uncharacterized protein YndB with AHSA1/START domain
MSDPVAVTVSIDAPADKVWSMIADVTRMGEWSPECTGSVWIDGATSPAVGARFKGTNANGSKSWETTATVVGCEEGSLFAFRIAAVGCKVAEWRYEIEPSATGCTVTETWIDERNALVKLLGKPISGVSDRAAHNRAGMEATLAALKASAEGVASS